MAFTNYRPLLAELRAIVREVREASSLGVRLWSRRIKSRTGYETTFRQVPRFEQGPDAHTLDAAYLLACALDANAEIIIGAEPRIIYGGVRGQARDFIQRLRRAAATDPSISAADVEDIARMIERALRS